MTAPQAPTPRDTPEPVENDSRPALPTDGVAALRTDVLVVGAGPVGLFQVFELGLLGIHAHVVDSLPIVGGQCALLYPDKPLYDIPGLPECSGLELVERLQRQIDPFETPFHLAQEVSQLTPRADRGFDVMTSTGTRFVAKAVVIAGGVGSFQPRRLKLDGLRAFEPRQVLHRLDDPAALAGQRVLVVGDGDPALEAALALVGSAATVTLMHRRDEFKADAATVVRLAEARAAGRIRFVAAQPEGMAIAADRLVGLTVLHADGSSDTVPLDTLLVLGGLSARLGPIADWGLALDRKQLVVDTGKFETDVPGIFAVGDVNTYPGKRRLIVCGFHEATLAAYAIAARVFPGEPVRLEYTTSSALLQRRLGRLG